MTGPCRGVSLWRRFCLAHTPQSPTNRGHSMAALPRSLNARATHVYEFIVPLPHGFGRRMVCRGGIPYPQSCAVRRVCAPPPCSAVHIVRILRAMSAPLALLVLLVLVVDPAHVAAECSIGFYEEVPGICTACEAGQYGADGVTCIPCPEETFSPPGMGGCEVCALCSQCCSVF
jgi:hypothetical protein